LCDIKIGSDMDEITKSVIFNEIIEIKDRVNKLSQTFAEAVNGSTTLNKGKNFEVKDYLYIPEHLKNKKMG
jgi:hypothetical protein